MATPLLALQDIMVQYTGGTVLCIPQLHVSSGEILAVIGPNGAGKSTLLRVIGLLERPARGTVRVHGKVVTKSDLLNERRRMASVFQAPLLLNASVYDNAALGLKLRRMDRRTTAHRVDAWLERLGIAHLRHRPARSLSGGEAQRTSLVRALALDPELLLLDEPYAALDPPSREALLLDLEAILRDTGTTTVFVTHERHEALTLGDRVAILFNGAIVQEGVPWQVFSHPATEAIARFVGADINIPGRLESVQCGTARVRTPVGMVEIAGEWSTTARVTLCVRPEDLTVHRVDDHLPPSSARNVLHGTITKMTPWGAQIRVTIDCGLPLTALVTRRSVDDLQLAVNLPVAVTFKATAVHVIRHHG